MATPELDIPAQASVAREYGFHGIDFRVGQPGRGEIPETLTAEAAAGIKAVLGELQLPGLLCYNKNIHAGQAAFAESVLENLQLARLLGCPMIRIFTGKIGSDPELAALTDALRSVLERDHSDSRIAMQIHRNNGVTVCQALAVCKALESSRVGIILSPDQSVPEDSRWEALLPEAAPHVFQLYVADIDDGGKFTPIGEGIIDYAGIIRTLRGNGFDGFITLKWEKCWLDYLPEYPEGFRSFAHYLKRHGLLP